MNRSIKTALLAAVLGTASTLTVTAQQFTQEQLAKQRALYTQAEGDIARGKFADAEKKARALIRVRPSDPYMRQLLARIQTARMDASRRTSWERSLKTLIVDEVNIDEASIEEVAAYIQKKAKALAGGDASPNIVLRGSAVRDRTVTLRLKNVPLSEVLRYAGQLADVRFTYEKHAIVGYDKRAEDAAKPAPEMIEPKVPGDGFPAVLGFEAPVIASPTTAEGL
jgi:hypothetical protein